MSDEKTLITHAQDKAKFLGYEIFIRKSDAVKRNKDGVLKRDFNGAVVLTLNSAVIQKKLTEYNALEVRNIDGKDIWWSKPRRYMTPMKPEDILAQYRRIGFQTQVWRQKENEEVFVTLRLGRVKASMIISMNEQENFHRLCDSQSQKEWLESMTKQLECKITEYYASSVEIRYARMQEDGE